MTATRGPLRPPLFHEPYLLIRRFPDRLLLRYDVYDTSLPDDCPCERLPESYLDYCEAVNFLMECRMRFIQDVRGRILDDLANMQAYHRAIYGWSL